MKLTSKSIKVIHQIDFYSLNSDQSYKGGG